MPRICYREKTFTAEHQAIIATADQICDEYEAQGFKLTLRQLYYQFVARAIIENSQQSYKRLGSIINDARIAGQLDWDAIEDRTRNLETLASWETPGDLLEACADQFKYDLWADQDHRVEVWVEKEALVGIIQPICDELRVPYFACRGYTSQSEAWAAGRRFKGYNGENQGVVVLHLGDHDPSGIDMTRDNLERIQLFSEFGDVKLIRLALNEEQVHRYRPPPNPAKVTDSRAEGYIAKFGHESWELDALEPKVIADLIRRNVKKYRDAEVWRESLEREEKAQERLRTTAEDFQS
jgi:hypothetical protein